MTKGLETAFKRIETKYIVDKDDMEALLADLKHYLVEDDYPTSVITNIYFDTKDFQMIRDSIAKKNGREKVRMRTYNSHPNEASQVFLELKKKDSQGIGHKFRLVSNLGTVTQFMEEDVMIETEKDQELLEALGELKERYDGLAARMYIYYERYSLKEKHRVKGDKSSKVRITIDQNLLYRDYDVDMTEGVYGDNLVGEDKVIMEIKTPGEQPIWLQDILEKHGIEVASFSKYGTAYRKSQGIFQ